MTLCIAWIRQEKEYQELVFATDSCLTGSAELWKNGVKLFELPRKDCLICFAGETFKAYPLILNLISSIKFDNKIMNQHSDLREVLEYLCPDTGIILDLEIPKDISNLKTDTYGNETTFIEKCYPDGKQKPDLSDKEKEMLLAIFKDNSYNAFLSNLTKTNTEINGETNE
jgi:hypothetical protein